MSVSHEDRQRAIDSIRQAAGWGFQWKEADYRLRAEWSEGGADDYDLSQELLSDMAKELARSTDEMMRRLRG